MRVFGFLFLLLFASTLLADVSVPPSARQQFVGTDYNRNSIYKVGSVYFAAGPNNTMEVKAPNLLDDSFVWVFPEGDGTADQVLTTQGDNQGTSYTFIGNANIAADADIDLSKLAALTSDRALQSSASGVVEASSVTATELSYLAGVTSAIQTQIDNISSGSFPTGDRLLYSSSGDAVESDIVLGGSSENDLSNVGNIIMDTAGAKRIELRNQSSIQFHPASGSGYLRFTAPSSISAPVLFTLPNGDGSSGQFLSTNGSGVLSWQSPPTLTEFLRVDEQSIGSPGATGQIATGQYIVADSVPGGSFAASDTVYNLEGLTDSSGNSRTLTQAGSSAVAFDGADIFNANNISQFGTDKRLTNSAAYWTLGDSLAFSILIYVNNVTTRQRIFDVFENALGVDVGLSISAGGSFELFAMDSNYNAETLAVAVPANDTWYRISGHVDAAGDEMRLYINDNPPVSISSLSIDADLNYSSDVLFQLGGSGSDVFLGRGMSFWFSVNDKLVTEQDHARFMAYRAELSDSTDPLELNCNSTILVNGLRTHIAPQNYQVHVTDDNIFWNLSAFDPADEFGVGCL